MKRTIVTALMGAFLLPHAFSAEPTVITGAQFESSNIHYGNPLSAWSSDASGYKVTISANPDGSDCSTHLVAAAFSTVGVTNNTLVMTGGEVASVYAGYLNSSNQGPASGNVLIISGGKVSTQAYGAFATSGSAHDNKVYLVGKGAKDISIADAQGTFASYTGDSGGVSVTSMSVGFSLKDCYNNSIDIYGSDVSLGRLQNFTNLNFHLVDALATANEAMLSDSFTLDLAHAELAIYGDEVTNWSQFEGKSITLVQMENDYQITGVEFSTKEVTIYDADKQVLGTATLELVQNQQSLVLSNIQGKNVPEPTTGTLSLLALAGLCARRRRK